jgi:histidinol dehydrogenase
VIAVSELIKQYDLRRKGARIPPVLAEPRSGAPSGRGRRAAVDAQARRIVEAVAKKGDAAVAAFTKEFDGVALTPRQFRVKPSEISNALNEIDGELRGSMEKALENIREFHEAAVPRALEYRSGGGVVLEERLTPIERVGVYVPGGKAFYSSTVLMTVVPAKVAGCKEIIVVSPPSHNGTIHPAILAAASLAGAASVFRIGGAQSIAALAYGTGAVPKVDKIVGPGNVYVTMAKRLVSGIVEIDKEAGPTDIVIIADKKANPAWVAADMLAQAEHEKDAQAILITNSAQLARKVAGELANQLEKLPRKRSAGQALKRNGAIVVTRNLVQAAELANMRAPEHLALMVEKPRALLKLIKNAGAIFLGQYSPVAVGDYIAGPSHVLPTGGTARYASALTVDDFIKRSSVIAYTKKRLAKDAGDIVRLAEAEGFDAHAESVKLRLKR